MRINSNVKEIIEAVENAARDARIEAVEEVTDEAQMFAPVKTGELRDSKFTEHTEETSIFGFSAEHSRHVEFGTSRTAAQPFFFPAAAGLENLVKKKLENKLENKLRGLK